MSAYSMQSANIRKTWILIFVFISMVSGVFYLFGAVNRSPGLAVLGLVISLVQVSISYFFGGDMALSSNGAVELPEEQGGQIRDMIENLAKIAGIPTPKIYISPDPSANAFACGRDPEHANICLNQGILDLLNRNELEGVIAHEMSHIKNRDILVMTMTMALSAVISFIADWGWRVMFWNNDDNDRNGSPVILVLYVITIMLAPVLATIISLSISRSREYLADATGVTLTRYPAGLKNALLKLYNNPVPTEHYSTAMNHFFIAPPKKTFGETISGLFSTHPPLEDRIKALDEMDRG
jgi:heat shock protein HtpX